MACPGYLCRLTLFAGPGWFVLLSTLCHAKICVLWAAIVWDWCHAASQDGLDLIRCQWSSVHTWLWTASSDSQCDSSQSARVSIILLSFFLMLVKKTVCWLNKFPVSSSSLSSSEIYLLGWILLERKQIVFHSNSSSVVTKSSRRCKVTPTSVTGTKISLAVLPCNGF